MITPDAAFSWAIGKAAMILVSAFGTLIYLAWIGVKRGLLK